MTLNRPDMNQEQFEAICSHCGVCCGSQDGDPCIYLEQRENGGYYCRIYSNRLGKRITVKGNEFRCIPIEQAIKYSNVKEVCRYAKFFKNRTSP